MPASISTAQWLSADPVYSYVTSASVTNGTWTSWQQDTNANCTANTAVTTTLDLVWYSWYDSSRQAVNQPYIRFAPDYPVQTAEAQAAREVERVERIRVRNEANARAELLLKENLDAKQLQELAGTDRFTVISKDGTRHYRIFRGRSRNIERIDALGRRMHTLCAHPVDDVPDADTMLTQKLMLEHCEEDFLKVANRS